MIPVAAVARPRQGIRVPAPAPVTPALSAGTITATAGDGQVTISRVTAPSGAITTRTLYRSTAAGTLGAEVTTFTGTFPFTDSGRQNGTTLYYTLRVSDGSATADTPQTAGVTPAASTSTLIMSHDWEDNTWGPIVTPSQGDPADYSIVTAPAWFGTGKVAAIRYHRDSTSEEELDPNRAFYIEKPGFANFSGTGMTFGGEGYVEFDLGFDVPTYSGFLSTDMQCKIVYPQWGNTNNDGGSPREDWGLTSWGRVDGSGLDFQAITGSMMSPSHRQTTPQGPHIGGLNWQEKHRLAFGWRINSASEVADAEWYFWLDDVLRHSRTGFIMFRDPTTIYHTLYQFAVGDQEQGNTNNKLSLFDHTRYFDNLKVYNRRPGS